MQAKTANYHLSGYTDVPQDIYLCVHNMSINYNLTKDVLEIT